MSDLHVRTETTRGVVHAAVITEALSEDRVCTIVADNICDALSKDAPSCLLDAQQLRYCTSTGIGCLVRIHNACRAAKGRLVIVNLDPMIADSIKIARLDRLFTIAKDDKAARKALA